MRLSTRPRKYSRSFTFRAVFVGVVFTLTVVYQKAFPDNKRKELDAAVQHEEDLQFDYQNELPATGYQSHSGDPRRGAGGVGKASAAGGGGGGDLDTKHLDYLSPADRLEESKGNLLSHLGVLRRLLIVVLPAAVPSVNDTSDNVTSTDIPPSNHTDHHICTPPAYHEFPTDVFTSEQRQNGAIILHFIMVIYMFTALAVVCDIYFVASLEKICEKLNLSADVAGATFMAAGSSAPELFTSIIGVFIAKGDVGVGTIVGSAVFNILFVVGICGVLVSQPVPLSWYPLMRDSFFYVLSVIILIGSIADSAITWYESSIMLVVYIIYIIVMKFNPQLQAWITPRVHLFAQSMQEDASKIMSAAANTKTYGAGNTYDGPTNVTEMFSNEANGGQDGGWYQSGPPPPGVKNGRSPGPGGLGQTKVIPVDDYVLKSTRKISFEDACFRFMKMRGFRPKTRFWAAVSIIICERRKLLRDPVFMRREQQAMYTYGSIPESYSNANQQNVVDAVEAPEPANDWKRIPRSDEGYLAQVRWAVLLPINIILYYTVPDCGQPRWSSWFMVSFIMSIVWIAAFSYVMVWMVTLIGYTIGIPDSIMGITFLAAGTSVPDAMASVMVARQGQGDMAVSNTIGSNVFDVLIGLALPWWLMTACVHPGSAVHINSNGMVFSVILLFLTVIITIVAIHLGGWRLDKKLGAICLTCYAIFLTFSCMIEYNVFGYVNPPMCRE